MVINNVNIAKFNVYFSNFIFWPVSIIRHGESLPPFWNFLYLASGTLCSPGFLPISSAKSFILLCWILASFCPLNIGVPQGSIVDHLLNFMFISYLGGLIYFHNITYTTCLLLTNFNFQPTPLPSNSSLVYPFIYPTSLLAYLIYISTLTYLKLNI